MRLPLLLTVASFLALLVLASCQTLPEGYEILRDKNPDCMSTDTYRFIVDVGPTCPHNETQLRGWPTTYLSEIGRDVKKLWSKFQYGRMAECCRPNELVVAQRTCRKADCKSPVKVPEGYFITNAMIYFDKCKAKDILRPDTDDVMTLPFDDRNCQSNEFELPYGQVELTPLDDPDGLYRNFVCCTRRPGYTDVPCVVTNPGTGAELAGFCASASARGTKLRAVHPDCPANARMCKAGKPRKPSSIFK